MIAFLRSLDADAVNVVGIRAAESAARSQLGRWDSWDELDCDVWRPLIDWTEADVVAIHQKHGLAPNPLYLRGARRVGCWPCIFARKSDIRMVARETPERIEEIRQLETDVADRASARYAAQGETFESKGYHPPTFFHTKKHRRPETNGMVPIDDAVTWANNIRPGRETDEAFQAPFAGCLRWGMCDPHS